MFKIPVPPPFMVSVLMRILFILYSGWILQQSFEITTEPCGMSSKSKKSGSWDDDFHPGSFPFSGAGCNGAVHL